MNTYTYTQRNMYNETQLSLGAWRVWEHAPHPLTPQKNLRPLTAFQTQKLHNHVCRVDMEAWYIL